MLRGGNSRVARGQSPNRGRASSRGRGSTSRGASNSSGKHNVHSNIPTGPRALQAAPRYARSNQRGGILKPNFKKQYLSYNRPGTSPTENSLSDNFEDERAKNAQKREQLRGTTNATVNGKRGRGNSRGTFNNKQVRFANPVAADPKEDSPSKSPSPAPPNPFAPATTPSLFGAPATMSVNPFAATTMDAPKSTFSTFRPSFNPFAPATTPSSFGAPTTTSTNPFGAAKTEASKNPFGSPSPSSNPFGPPPQSSTTTNTFGTPSLSSPFGASSQPSAMNAFGTPNTSSSPLGAHSQLRSTTNATGTPSSSSNSFGAAPSKPSATTNLFGKPSGNPGTPSMSKRDERPSTLQQASTAPPQAVPPVNIKAFGAKPNKNGFASKSRPTTQSKSTTLSSPTPTSATDSALTKMMDQLLKTEKIIPPDWPTTPGDPRQKGAVEAFWKASKVYRAKVRAALIRGGFLDDPDKPKKLSEAIDFKGTCEDMCPEFEKVTRIMEHDVQNAEKELAPDGSTMWPAPQKMVKALARSAAGQDAPLPTDVRSPAALRRTLDYLLHTVLGEEGDLPSVHGFLWDRTRAIRRDFVFQQSSMTPSEISDQIYCLERITRFHVIALHQMSREGAAAEDFVEQQEVEQLGKALLSLIHAYEDCQAQGIHCENEAEFRAYYVLFNSHNPAILETVQNWGWKFWGESEQVKIAVSLVETLQNIWDTRGPLNPHSATDIAQNGYSRFFSLVENKKVSYTMACFAEIHFNSVRKSALKTILTSYRKQRDQTKDWTLTRLNAYLRFDDEEDIIEFGEAYGLQFQQNDEETYLSFESEDISDPFPPYKQPHSYALVERKRGHRSLPAVIDATVYDEGELMEEPSDDESLFVKDSSARPTTVKAPVFPPSTTSTFLNYSAPAPVEAPVFPSFATSASSNGSTPTPMEAPVFPSFATSKSLNGSTPTPMGTPAFPSFTSPKPLKDPVVTPNEAPVFPSHTTSKPLNDPAPMSKEAPVFPSFTSPKPLNDSAPTTKATSVFPSFTAPTLNDSAPTPNATPVLPSLTNSKSSSDSAPMLTSMPKEAPIFPSMMNSRSNDSARSPSPQPQFSFGGVLATPPSTSPAPAYTIAATKKPAVDNRKAQLDNLTQWVAVGDRGIIDQFTEHHVEQLLREAVGIYMKERVDRKAREEAERARAQADEFRYRSLATKYGHRWREAAHRMWLRRKGREARRARREMAESFRASKVLQSANVVEDFRASATSSRRGSLESLLDATGEMNGFHDTSNEIRAIVQREEPEPSTKRRRADRSTESPASSTISHRGGKSDNPLRRSILSDPSYLQGGSRIHLMSKYDARDENHRQVSGVQTDYFRLKARGISTLPDGTPLASSAAKDLLQQPRSSDGITKPTTPKKSLMPPPVARSVPSKPVTQREEVWKGADSSEVIRAMKARARAFMDEDQEPRSKKRTFDDEAELFARAKRVREQLEEGSQWYQKQVERDTKSRSAS